VSQAVTILKTSVLSVDIIQNKSKLENETMKNIYLKILFLLAILCCQCAVAASKEMSCHAYHTDSGWRFINDRKLKEDVNFARNANSLDQLTKTLGAPYSKKMFSGLISRRWLYGATRRSVTNDCKKPKLTEYTFEYYQLIASENKNGKLDCRVYRKTHITQSRYVNPISDEGVLPFSVSLMSCVDWLKEQ
jgi:hypothetical protein